MPDIIHIHFSRRCANCAHVDTDNDHQCWQLVSMVDGSAMPTEFACGEHQTAGEYRLDLHRPRHMVLGLA